MTKLVMTSNDRFELLSEIDFLEAGTRLAAGWGGLVIPDAPKLEALLADGTARLRQPQMKAAANAGGLGDAYATVVAMLDRLEVMAGSDAGQAMLRLLSRVDKFSDDGAGEAGGDPGLVRLPLLSVAQAGGSAPLSFNVGANAAIAFEAGDCWPYRSDSASDAGLDGLLRIAVDGEAEAGADASLPLGYASLTLGADVRRAASLAWYVTPASPSQIFADAVVSAVSQLPLPTRFDALWNAVQTSNLKGVIFAIDGEIAMAADVSLATSGVIGGVGGIGGAVTIKAQIRRASRFQLSARAIGKPGGGVPRPVVVTVTSAKSRQTTLGVDFAVTLHATDLREKTASIVRNGIATWDARLAPIEKFLSPGSFLRDELASLLDASVATITSDSALQAALRAEARRSLGLEPGEAELKAWARDAIIDAVSTEADKVHAGAEAAIDAVVLCIPVGGAAAPGAALLKTEIAKLLRAFDAGLTTAVGDIVAAPGAGLNDMLNRVGVSIDHALGTVDAQLAAVRALLKRFDDLLGKIGTATEKAANFRLQISLSTETVTREWGEFMFCATFSRNTPETRRLFDHLVAGRVDRVADLLRGGSMIAGIVIDETRSFALRGKAWKNETSIGAFVLGFDIASQQILTAEAVVRTTTDGIVVTGKAGATHIDKRPDGTQIVKFSSPYTLALATGSDPLEPLLGLTLDINRFEKHLTEAEVGDLLDSLVEYGLLPALVREQARDLWRRWQPIGGSNSKVPGRIELGFALDSQAVARLYRRAERVNRGLPPPVKLDVARHCLAALMRAGVVSQKDLERGLGLARARVHGEPDTDSAAAHLLYLAEYRGQWDAPRPGESGIVRGAYEKIVRHFGGQRLDGSDSPGKLAPLLDALDAMGDLALASPLPPDNWRETDYLAALTRVSNGFAKWLGGNSKLDKLDDEIRPQLIAFMLLVRSLAKLPVAAPATVLTAPLPAAPIYLVMSRGPNGDEERTVIV